MSLLLLDGAGEDLFDVSSSTMVVRTPEISKTWPSFEWAHAYERAWCVRPAASHTRKCAWRTRFPGRGVAL